MTPPSTPLPILLVCVVIAFGLNIFGQVLGLSAGWSTLLGLAASLAFLAYRDRAPS